MKGEWHCLYIGWRNFWNSILIWLSENSFKLRFSNPQWTPDMYLSALNFLQISNIFFGELLSKFNDDEKIIFVLIFNSFKKNLITFVFN